MTHRFSQFSVTVYGYTIPVEVTTPVASLYTRMEGTFLCAACDLPLFTSKMKFDSGTGWPSFFTTIAGHVGKKTDYKILVTRTEYHCVRCGGHQGHVFNDGPQPTGERWCNNGVALKFVAGKVS